MPSPASRPLPRTARAPLVPVQTSGLPPDGDAARLTRSAPPTRGYWLRSHARKRREYAEAQIFGKRMPAPATISACCTSAMCRAGRSSGRTERLPRQRQRHRHKMRKRNACRLSDLSIGYITLISTSGAAIPETPGASQNDQHRKQQHSHAPSMRAVADQNWQFCRCSPQSRTMRRTLTSLHAKRVEIPSDEPGG